MAQQPLVGQDLLIIEPFRSHSRHKDTKDQPEPDTSTVNTQHSQESDIRAYSGIRTHNSRKLAVADLGLRLRGRRDRSSHLINY
jgi:hypothetical protein